MASKAQTISMPEELVEMMDELAARGRLTRGELIQEALRRYAEQEQPGTPWLRQLYDAYAPVRERIAASGMTEDEINQIIDEEIAAYRREKRAESGD